MEKIKCVLCDLDECKVLFKSKDLYYHLSDYFFSLVQCNHCGLIYVNPRPSKEEINMFYPEHYFNSVLSPVTRVINIFFKYRSNRMQSVKIFKKQGRLLDLGCGGGDFLSEMKKSGFEVYGIDSSSHACKLAQEKIGENVLNSTLEEYHFPDNYFDVVTLWHVYEHLPNPNKVLEEIYRILKKDGILILEIPNINSLSFKLFRKYCFHLEIPRHLYHWSSKTIKEILNRNKFEVLKIDYSFLRFSLGLFHSCSNLLNHLKMRSSIRQLFLIIVTPSFIILKIVFCFLPSNSEVLRVYARKNQMISWLS